MPSSRPRLTAVLLETWSGRVALLTLGLLILVSLFQKLVAPHDPYAQDLTRILELPTLQYPLGTDELGRDVLSRVVTGMGYSFLITAVSALIGGTIGTVAGLLAGYLGGATEVAILRLNDLLLALPGIILALIIIAMVGPGPTSLTVSLAVLVIAPFSRIVHGSVVSIRHAEYIWVARAVGVPDRTIIFRHILPNVATSIVTLAPIMASTNFIVGSSLSFLGLGLQPPTPELGLLTAEGRAQMWIQPYLSFSPGLTAALFCFCLNLLGQVLSLALDPYARVRTLKI